MATIGALVFEMSANVARLQQDMAKARSTVEGAMAGIQAAAGLAKTALAGLGVGVSFAAFESMITGSIEATASLHKLSLQTGISGEMLSALRGPAKQAGSTIDEVAGLVNKLEKNMLTFAQTGTGKAAAAFQQLGYSQADVQKGLKNMDTFLPEFAKRLIETGVGGEQAGLAMQLMAKGGAAALPFLKELAEQQQLMPKLTEEQIEAAHKFEVSLVKLQGQSTALKNHFVNEMVPTLNAFTGAMLDARKAGDGLFSSMIAGARAAVVEMLQPSLKGTLDTLKNVREEIARVQNMPYVDDGQLKALREREAMLEKTRNTLVDMAKFSGDMKDPEKKKTDLADVDGKAKKDAAAAKAAAERARLLKQDQENELESIRVRLAATDNLYRILAEKGDFEAARDKALLAEDLKNQIASAEAIIAENDRVQTAIAERMTATTKLTKDQSAWARELGLTFTSSFENAVVKGENLRTVLAGMLRDVEKIVARNLITEPAGKALSASLNSSSIGDFFSSLFGGGKASGGPVSGGTPYLVGEEGPELFVPGGNGTIVPNGGGGGAGGGAQVTLNVINQTGAPVASEQRTRIDGGRTVVDLFLTQLQKDAGARNSMRSMLGSPAA